MSKIKYEYGRDETYDKDYVVRLLEKDTIELERLAGEMVAAAESFGSGVGEFDTHALYHGYNLGYGGMLQGHNEVEMSIPCGDLNRMAWRKFYVLPIHVFYKPGEETFRAYLEYGTPRSKALRLTIDDNAVKYAKPMLLGHDLHLPTKPIEYFFDMAQVYTIMLAANENALAGLKATGKINAHIASFQQEPGWPAGLIKFEKVNSNVTCDMCGRWVVQAHLSRHKSSRTCQAETTSKDVREAGYVNVTHARGISRILKADVGVVARPKAIEYWAPGWVAAAIERYNEGKGFAGMSIDEYLQKMKPDEVEDAQLPEEFDPEGQD